MVAVEIIAAAKRLLRRLRDYEMGVNLRFTYWKDITQFIIKMLTLDIFAEKMHALHCGIAIENGSKIPPNVLGEKSMHCIVKSKRHT